MSHNDYLSTKVCVASTETAVNTTNADCEIMKVTTYCNYNIITRIIIEKILELSLYPLQYLVPV